jgi:hypothetical protein
MGLFSPAKTPPDDLVILLRRRVAVLEDDLRALEARFVRFQGRMTGGLRGDRRGDRRPTIVEREDELELELLEDQQEQLGAGDAPPDLNQHRTVTPRADVEHSLGYARRFRGRS